MKLKQILINSSFIGCVMLAGFTASCTKSGCTDSAADNYNAEAEKDDNSCLYGIDLTFYMSDATKEALTDAGVVPPLTVSIGSPTIADKQVGVLDWENDSTYAEVPTCDSVGTDIFNIRFVDYTKGSSTAAVSAKYGDGSSAYLIGHTLPLGEGACQVIGM